MKDNGPIQIFHIERLCRVRQKNNGEFKPLAFVDDMICTAFPLADVEIVLKSFCARRKYSRKEKRPFTVAESLVFASS